MFQKKEITPTYHQRLVNDGISFEIDENNLIPKVTRVQMSVNVSSNREDSSNFTYTTILRNGKEKEKDSLVTIAVAKDARLGQWSQWSLCTVSCLSEAQIYGEKFFKKCRNCFQVSC